MAGCTPGGTGKAMRTTQQGQSRQPTVEAEVVADVVARSDTASVRVIWGLTDGDKLTPVVVGADAHGGLVVGENSAAGVAFDMSNPYPCPCWICVCAAGKPRTPRPKP